MSNRSTQAVHLEIACFNALSALTAIKAGASRIELCKSYTEGGTTPSLADVEQVRKYLTETKIGLPVPLHVMIRPRAGNFCYSDDEVEQMEFAMSELAPLVDGFVLGLLTTDKRVDVGALRRLVVHSRTLDRTAKKTIVFHRALDEVEEPIEAIKVLADCGVDFVLTSGGARTAIQGLGVLADLVKEGRKHNVGIIVGGGVRTDNILALSTRTDAAWFHSAALPAGPVVDGSEAVDEAIIVSMRNVLLEGRT
jgi:copper homeostasis protein